MVAGWLFSLWETIRKKKSLKTAAHVRYVGCIGGVKAGVGVLASSQMCDLN